MGVIIGGVAGGASTATRLRRMDADMNIIIIERGSYISYATCGLPYHVGDVIPDEASLRVATPELLRNRFEIDVRTNTEALSINPEEQTVTIAPTVTLSAFASGTPSQTEGESPSAPTETLHYDYLVVATGAKAIVPP